MELKDIVSIAGVSGLHKIIGRTKSGLILETIGTAKRFPTSIQDKVSVLEDISMYTEEGDMKLSEVFVKVNEKEKAGTSIPDAKADVKAQREFVTATIKLDNERVYDSDVKKLLNWYHILKSHLDFATLVETPAEETATEGKPKAKKGSKKAEETDDVAAVAEEKPKAKKVAAPKTPKTAAPKNTAPKANSKGAGGAKTTYRPKSV
jgi:cell division septation protein DedD